MAIRFHVFYILMLLYCSVHYGKTASNVENRKSMRRYQNKWTQEEDENLIFFDVSTDDGKRDQFKRIRSLWNNEYPNSNVTDSALHKRLHELRRDSGEGERRKKFRWNNKRKRELLEVYYTTKPYNPNAKRTLEEEWKRRYEDCQILHRSLHIYAVKLSKEKDRRPEYLEEGTSDTDLEWDDEQDSDLLHAHNVAQLEGEVHLKITHHIWSDLYPQYRNVKPQQLKERITHLKNYPPNENFPWTEEENKELLDIYDKTVPDEEDQGQRIYDIWSRIHPRYKFMTPYYLQIHASTLAHKRELRGANESTGRRWTHAEKADAVNLYHRYLGHRDANHEFHKEWVRKHPRLAYYTNLSLKGYARVLENRGFRVDPEKFGEGSSRQTKGKCRLEKKQEHHGRYNETAKACKHSKRLMRIFGEKQEAYTPLRFGSFKKLMGATPRGDSEKRAGKAPVVHSSDEELSAS